MNNPAEKIASAQATLNASVWRHINGRGSLFCARELIKPQQHRQPYLLFA